MGKKKHGARSGELLDPAGGVPRDPMKNREYLRLLRPLHGELGAVQEWAKAVGARICTVFDRSGYNRAGVERVMGFCTEAEADHFLQLIPVVERAIVDSGVIMVKYWLELSEQQQTLRLQSRIDDPRKIWKLSDLDLESYSHWYDFSRARDPMFHYTDTGWAPWFVVSNDDKKRGRLTVIEHLLTRIPYQPLEHRDIELPARQRADGYRPPTQPLHWIPTPY